jgi:hypothetical protein
MLWEHSNGRHKNHDPSVKVVDLLAFLKHRSTGCGCHDTINVKWGVQEAMVPRIRKISLGPWVRHRFLSKSSSGTSMPPLRRAWFCVIRGSPPLHFYFQYPAPASHFPLSNDALIAIVVLFPMWVYVSAISLDCIYWGSTAYINSTEFSFLAAPFDTHLTISFRLFIIKSHIFLPGMSLRLSCHALALARCWRPQQTRFEMLHLQPFIYYACFVSLLTGLINCLLSRFVPTIFVLRPIAVVLGST